MATTLQKPPLPMALALVGVLAVAVAACSSAGGAATTTSSASTASAADSSVISSPPSATSSPASAVTAQTAGSTASSEAATGSSSPASLVPASLKAKGTLVVGSEIAYPPFESYPVGSKVAEGFDIDLGNAIAERLGLKLDWTNTSFTGILAGLSAGRYDLVISGMSDTPDRRKEADFVDYATDGLAITVKAGNPLGIKGFADLCGHEVGTEAGSTNYKLLDAQSSKCTADGKKPVTVTNFQGVDAMFLALSSGRIDILSLSTSAAAYRTGQSHGTLMIAFTMPSNPLGIAVKKGSTEFATALQQATQSLMDDGTYDTLLNKWGMHDLRIEKATVNNNGTGS